MTSAKKIMDVEFLPIFRLPLFLMDPETALLEIVLLGNLFLGTVTWQLLRTSHIPEQRYLYSMSIK